MATQSTQDDGLIILSDDTSVQFDTPVSTPTLNLVPELNTVNQWVTISQPVVANTQSSDFHFDFNLEAAPLVLKEEVKIDTPIQDMAPSLDLNPTSVSSETPLITETPVQAAFVTPSVQISSDDDMDTILDGTIAKLKARQDVINTTKEKKNTRIADLTHQIEELQQQVSDLKDDVNDLNDEHMKIETNVKSLESMKMFEVPQIDEKSREHNLSKVAKK